MPRRKAREAPQNRGPTQFAPHKGRAPAPAPASGAPSGRWWPWVLFAFGLLLYVQTVRFDYCLDDRMLITENKLTARGFAGVPAILTTDSFFGYFGERKNYLAGGRYRPLSQVVFAASWQLFGATPAAGHLLNALVYACTGVVLFLVLRRLLPGRDSPVWWESAPLVAAAIFIAHPLHTEAVANIKGLDEILCLLWSLAALHGALLYARTRRAHHLLAAAGAFLLALLSKESAIAFLVIVPLTRYVFCQTSAASSLAAALPLLPAVGVYAALRLNAVGWPQRLATSELLNDPFVHADFGQRSATVLATWGRYLKLLVIPHPLTHDYYPWHLRLVGWGDPWAWGSLLVCLGLLGWALATIRRRSLAAYGILFFFCAFLLQSNLFFSIGTFMNERFLFTPVLGFALSVAALTGPGSGARRALAPALILALVGAYALKTVTRNEAWRDRLTLFSTDVATSSNSAKCNAALGEELAAAAAKETDPDRQGQLYARAKSHYAKAVGIYPGYAIAWVLFGNTALNTGDTAAALDCYEGALRADPGHGHAINNLQVAAARARERRRPDLSAKALAILVRYQPRRLDYRYTLAGDLEASGAGDAALAVLREIVRLEPGQYRAYHEIGRILESGQRDAVGALANFEKAAALTDKDGYVWEDLGVAYLRAERPGEGIAALERSLKINPENPRAWGRLGDAYGVRGDVARSQESYKRQRELAARPR